MKVTLPVGVLPATLAVSTTPWPTAAGLGEAVSVVLAVDTALTTRDKAADVLAALLALPAYAAVIDRVPAVAKVVVSDAAPLASVAVPRTVVPSRKVTDPVGALPVKRAVSVTGCVVMTGFGVADDVVLVVANVLTTSEDAVEVLA